ncbi:MAG: hypothetical protein DRP71_05565 [Verrucomicrobia bacterium]|nr:MAG: hypothetical protein DRP71_05565 [Verrucomicrobiota bacterium]
MPNPLSAISSKAQWADLGTTDFTALPRRNRTLIVLPVVGLADWGFGRPLDLEENLTAAVLNHALDQVAGQIDLLVLPPQRFVAAPYDHAFFGMDVESTGAALSELAKSIHASGFRRLLFLNTSPWNEEIIDMAARDLRVATGMEIFCINLAGIGLDLHPDRSRNRTDIQHAASFIYGKQSDEPRLPSRAGLTWFRPGRFDQPPPLSSAPDLEATMDLGQRIITRSGDHLSSLLREIHARPALPALKPGNADSPQSD